MNPILRKKIDMMHGQIDGLRDILEDNRDELARQHEAKEELLQKQWSQRRRLTTLGHMEDEFDELSASNTQYAKERKDLRQRLLKVRAVTRALQDAYRPS